MTPFQRTELLLGASGLQRLQAAHVLIVGLGGVGGHCAEACARSGIGRLTLMDGDVVTVTNLNRQLVATYDTVGHPKAQAMAVRLRAIHPDIQAVPVTDYFSADTPDTLLDGVDFVVDAIDQVSAKVALAVRCAGRGIPQIAAMGAGNKLDPTAFRIGDIFATRNDPLARVMRQQLRKHHVAKLPVVYSEELPRQVQGEDQGKRCVGSVAFVPAVAGLVMAGYVVRMLAGGVT